MIEALALIALIYWPLALWNEERDYRWRKRQERRTLARITARLMAGRG